MNKERCTKFVIFGAWGKRHYCKRSAWKDGFCKQHHPSTVEARETAAMARWEQKQKNSPMTALQNALRRIAELESEVAGLKLNEDMNARVRLLRKAGE